MLGSLQRPAARALAINLAVIRAILLRDLSLLAGQNGIGFVMLLLMPLGHLVAITIIYSALGRIAPVGNDQMIYFGLSILPFVIFVYPCRQLMMALTTNKALLYFNRVKITDLLFARGIIELGSSIVVASVVFITLLLYSSQFLPRDPAGLVFAIAGTIYLGFSVGVFNSLIGQIIPIWFLLFNLSAPIIWISSGIVFFPAVVPEPYNHWLAFNPLLQCIEWMRYSYYEDYPDNLLDIPYIFLFSTASLMISLVGEKFARGAIR